MKKLLSGAVMAVFFVGCGPIEEREMVVEYPPVDSSTSELQPKHPPPQFCLGSCPSTPAHEPLGQLCTFDYSTCTNGVLNCYYKCVAVGVQG